MQSPSLMHSHPRQKPGTFGPNALHPHGAAPGGDAAGRHAAAPGAAEGTGLWGRQTSTSGRAQHTWRAAPAPPGLQPAPAEPWGLHNAQHHAPRGSAPSPLPPAPCCGPMAGAGTGLSQEGGYWVGGCRAVSPMEPQEFGEFAGGHPGGCRRGSGPCGVCRGDGLTPVGLTGDLGQPQALPWSDFSQHRASGLPAVPSGPCLSQERGDSRGDSQADVCRLSLSAALLPPRLGFPCTLPTRRKLACPAVPSSAAAASPWGSQL